MTEHAIDLTGQPEVSTWPIFTSHDDEVVIFQTQENALLPGGLHLSRDAWSGLGWPETVKVTVQAVPSNEEPGGLGLDVRQPEPPGLSGGQDS